MTAKLNMFQQCDELWMNDTGLLQSWLQNINKKYCLCIVLKPFLIDTELCGIYFDESHAFCRKVKTIFQKLAKQVEALDIELDSYHFKPVVCAGCSQEPHLIAIFLINFGLKMTNRLIRSSERGCLCVIDPKLAQSS